MAAMSEAFETYYWPTALKYTYTYIENFETITQNYVSTFET
jgi:hypothetical protein